LTMTELHHKLVADVHERISDCQELQKHNKGKSKTHVSLEEALEPGYQMPDQSWNRKMTPREVHLRKTNIH